MEGKGRNQDLALARWSQNNLLAASQVGAGRLTFVSHTEGSWDVVATETGVVLGKATLFS